MKFFLLWALLLFNKAPSIIASPLNIPQVTLHVRAPAQDCTIGETWSVTPKKASIPSALYSGVYGEPGIGIDKKNNDYTEYLAVASKTGSVISSYLNSLQKELGIIIALDNSRTAGDLFWNQVIFAIWKDKAATAPALNWVFRDNVVEEISLEIAEEILGGAPAEMYETELEQFLPGNDKFYAWVGSPNGRGVTKLLTAQGKALGFRTISSVYSRVVDGSLELAFKITT
ncbi:hypothetical protein MMC18_006299 [Xylographa bjoerkii]|nr:hypothetical protein [Xylographa bjoerkii]